MNKFKIIENLFRDKECVDYCLKVSRDKNIAQDLIQYGCEQLLNRDESFIIELHNTGSLKKYFAGIIYKSFNSDRSGFYNEHLKKIDSIKDYLVDLDSNNKPDLFYNIKREDIESEILAYEVISEKNWYEASIFRLYLDYGNLRSLSEALSIPVSSLAISIKNIKKRLRKKLCEKYF